MRRSSPTRGFTLVELLIAATLSAFAMTALLACFVFLARNFARIANQQRLETQSRTALAYLSADVALAQGVKTLSTPTATQLTLVLPAGEVTYLYDPFNARLRRSATFGVATIDLLTGQNCRCTSLTFNYYTGTNGSPVSQISTTTNIPYSIKQLQVNFVLQTRIGEPAQTAVQRLGSSPRLTLRNRRSPDGT